MSDPLTFTDEELEAARRRIAGNGDGDTTIVRPNFQAHLLNETDSPDDAAYDLQKAQEDGVPRIAVSPQRQMYRDRDELRRLEKLKEDSPRLAEWMSRPDNYAVARDDVGTLQQIGTGLYHAPTQIYESARKMVRQTPKALEQWKYQGFQSKTERRLKLAEMQIKTIGEMADEFDNERDRLKFLHSRADELRQLREDVRTFNLELIGRGAYLGELREDISGIRADYYRDKPQIPEDQWTANAILYGFDSLVHMAPAVAVGVATRNPWAAGSVMGGDVGLDSYTTGIEQGLSHEQAQTYGAIDGTIELIGERFGFGALFGKNASKSLKKRIFEYMLREQLQEQPVTVAQDYNAWKFLNPDKTMDEFLAERPKAAYQTAIATLTATGPLAVTGAVAEDAMYKQMDREKVIMDSQQGEAVLNGQIANAGKSKLRTRSPEKFREAVEAQVEGSKSETTFIDLDGLNEALEQSGIPLDQATEALGISPEQYFEALATEGQVEVKTADLLSNEFFHDNLEAIKPHTKRDAEDMTPHQLAPLREAAEQEIEDAKSLIAERIEGDLTLAEQVADVEQRVFERIEGAGIYTGKALQVQADVHAALINALALRTGENPVEFFEREAPRIFGSVGGEVMREGVLRQFAGSKAKTADLSLRDRAQSMKETGSSAQDIFQETGWSQGADGQWRFEIDDSSASLDMTALKPGKTARLEDIFKHDALFEAYPQLRGMKIKLAKEERGFDAAFYPPIFRLKTKLGWLMLSPGRSDEAVLNTILHEVQHQIQQIEDFGYGSSSRLFEINDKKVPTYRELPNFQKAVLRHAELEKELEQLKSTKEYESQYLDSVIYQAENTSEEFDSDEYQKVTEQVESLFPLVRQRNDLMKEIVQLEVRYNFDNPDTKLTPDDMYWNTAGEVEARNVERRRGMTEQERRETLPEETEDVRRGDQFIVSGGSFSPIIRSASTSLDQSPDSPTGQFDPDQNIIALFEKADMSTLIHESAHWYLSLLERLAQSEDAHPFIREQLDAIDSWFSSIENTPQMKAIRERYGIRENGGMFEIHYAGRQLGAFATREEAEAKVRWRERQEAFAETFEQYLETGKAPSKELRTAFRAFRDFLTMLYRKVIRRRGEASDHFNRRQADKAAWAASRQQRANFNPEVTEVFDRMLATDDAIQRAKAKTEIDFRRFAKAHVARRKLSPDQEEIAIARLEGQFNEALEKVHEEYLAEQMAQIAKNQKAFVKGEKRRIKSEVTREVDQAPGRRATEWLGRGVWKGETGEEIDVNDESAVYQGSDPAERSAWERAEAKGLDMSQKARMARAKAMGFDTKNPVYHGTVHEFEEFSLQPPRSDSAFRLVHPNDEGAVFVTPDVDLAESYAKFDGRTPLREGEREKFQHGSHVRKLFIKPGKQLVINAKGKEWVDVWPDALAKARAGGYDTIKIKNVQDWGTSPELTPRQEKKYLRRVSMGYDTKHPLRTSIAVLNPANIRSIHAAFDPSQSSSANLLYQGAELDMSHEARMARADEQGYTIEAYHGSWSDIEEFRYDSHKLGIHVGTISQAHDIDTVTKKKRLLRKSEYTEATLESDKGAVIYPLRVRAQNPLRLPDLETWHLQDVVREVKKAGVKIPDRYLSMSLVRQAIMDAGYDSIVYRNDVEGRRGEDSYIIFDPANIRSVNAAFDPAQSGSANILMQGGEVSAPVGFQDRIRREDFLQYETEQEPIAGEPKDAIRYGFRLPGEHVPVLVEVIPDSWSKSRRIDISRFDEASWEKTAPDFTPAKLSQFMERLHAIVEANLTIEGVSIEVYDAEEAMFYAEFLEGIAPSGYKVEIFREQEVFLIPRRSVLTNQGRVEDGRVQRSYESEGRANAADRAAFIDRATDANFSERLTRAVESRTRRIEEDRQAGLEYREQLESWMGRNALDQSGDPKGWGPVDPPENLEEVTLDLDAVRDGYGKPDDPYYAVRRLPQTVRHAAAAKKTVDQLFEQAKQARDVLKAKPPKSLIGFLRSRSIKGLKDPDGELKRMDAGRERGLINNKSGTDLDYAREAATEAGYLTATTEDGRTTIQDLLDALDSELSGNPVYAERDLDEAFMREEAEAIEDRFSSVDVDIMSADDATLRSAAEGLLSQDQPRAITPDEAADMFGFDNGEQLLEAMYALKNRNKIIEQETDRRFAEEMGDDFIDGQLTQEARTEAEAELRMRKGEIELEALRRTLGRGAAKSLAKQMAQERVRQMSVAEIGRFRRFRQAERRHGENAIKALEDGDLQQAMIHKQRQLVAMYMYTEAEATYAEIEKRRKHLLAYLPGNRETKPGRRRQINAAHLERIEAILEEYELRVSKQGGAARAKAIQVRDWVAEMKAADRDTEVSGEAELLAEEGGKQTWKSMTAEETELLEATIDNIAHLGRRWNKLATDKDRRKFKQAEASLVQTLKSAPRLPGTEDRNQSFSKADTEEITSNARWLDAYLTKMEHTLVQLDGQENGALFNFFWGRLSDAANKESKMQREATKRVRKIWRMYSGKERFWMYNKRINTPELPAPGKGMVKADVLAIALNWGNEYNRDVLLQGYVGWTKEGVEALLARVMTKKDWDFVRAVWAEIGSFKEESFALHKRATGITPAEVEGINFEIMVEGEPQTIEGQYYPVSYDRKRPSIKSAVFDRQVATEELTQQKKSYVPAITKHGSMKERKGSGGKPVSLDLAVFDRHISERIHDIAYREALIDMNRMVKSEAFGQAYIDAAGLEQFKLLEQWLKDIANPPVQQKLGPLMGIPRTVRHNMPIRLMGMKVGTAVIQITGGWAAVPYIGHKYAALGVFKAVFMNGPLSIYGAWRDVAKKSEFMRDRPQNFDRDAREVLTRMKNKTPLGRVQQYMFITIAAMDMVVSTSTWIGAYDKAMAGEVENIKKGDEAAAIAFADSIVRRSQTAGLPQDLSAPQRGSEIEKQFTMIYSWFSNQYNIMRTQVKGVRTGQIQPHHFMYNMALLTFIIPVMAEFLSGRWPPDEDDDETVADATFKVVVSNFAAMFPVVRTGVDYYLNPQYGYKTGPVQSGLEDVALAIGNALSGETFETRGKTKKAVNAVGTVFGLPTGQLWITGEYIYDWANGEEDPLEDPLDAMSEAFLRDTR